MINTVETNEQGHIYNWQAMPHSHAHPNMNEGIQGKLITEFLIQHN